MTSSSNSTAVPCPPLPDSTVSHGDDSQVAESLNVLSTASMTAAGTTVIVTRRGSGDSIEDEVADDDADTKGPSAKRFLLLGNTSGFPMDDETWDRMWRNIQKINPTAKEDVERIRNSDDLPTIPMLRAPMSLPASIPARRKIRIIQNYMDKLQYNHTGMKLFDVRKEKTYAGLMETAKEMVAESLPIKCLEAVLLGAYLTNSMPRVHRFAISFKTRLDGLTFRHIVLGLHHDGTYGSIGMSRRASLQDKPFRFETVTDLIEEFRSSYSDCLHEVLQIRISNLFPHSDLSREQVKWKHVNVAVPPSGSKETFQAALEKFDREIKSKVTSSPSRPLLDRHKSDSSE